jgi:outer membrane biosynthesis protein TonB
MMNRFEKKCFIGSAGFHGLLLLAFVFGSAFISSKKTVEIGPVVNLIAIPTDRDITSGGNPNSTQPQPAQPQPPVSQPPPPQPKPAEPEPPKPVKPVEPVPQKLTETKPKKPAKEEDKVKDKVPVTVSKKPATSDISTNVVRRSTADVAKLQREADQRAAQARADQLAWDRRNAQLNQIARNAGDAVSGLKDSIGKAVAVDSGAGPGGPAFAHYGSLVAATYKRSVDSNHPQSDESVDAVIRASIARDGTVLRATWVRRTSNPSLNKAVDQALKDVRSVPRFPSETKDTERTFTITLSFEAKRSA